MILKQLANSIDANIDCVPKERINDFSQLASQTSLQERESLYALIKFSYSGEGDIWDIGCGAGGSSFCLAAGMKDNVHVSNKNLKVQCFDLFNGHPKRAFKGIFPAKMKDIEIFNYQIRSVHEFLKPHKLNLITDFEKFPVHKNLEVVHIDAAKSLELWKAIFEKISTLIIPKKTIWIFQDFERARLPWQIYSLAELMRFGEIMGGANYGTVYFKFNSTISISTIKKILTDGFTISEKEENVKKVFYNIRKNHMSLFSSKNYSITDITNTLIAYCFYWDNQKMKAKEILKNTSKEYLSQQGNKIYYDEIFKGYNSF